MASRTSQARITKRIEQHYTLPLGNIRVYDYGVRELFSEVEDEFEFHYGFRPSRTDVLLAALRGYLIACRKARRGRSVEGRDS